MLLLKTNFQPTALFFKVVRATLLQNIPAILVGDSVVPTILFKAAIDIKSKVDA